MTTTAEAPEDLRSVVEKMTAEERQNLLHLLTPRVSDEFTPHKPHPKQQIFLFQTAKEVLFGGSAGPGKSDALLMAALQYVDVPGYSALLLRKSYSDLILNGAIMDRLGKWLAGTRAKVKDGGKYWLFPSGARVQFGYLNNKDDKLRYQSAEFTFIGFDELTQFNEDDYLYMFSRLRTPTLKCVICDNRLVQAGPQKWVHKARRNIIKTSKRVCGTAVPDYAMLDEYPPSEDGTYIWDVPTRMRSASNPGGPGHSWVKTRFIDEKTRHPGTIFVPARLKDNPSVDATDYTANLEHLGALDRERLLNGDWDVAEEGNMFRRHWWGPPLDRNEIPTDAHYARFWDLAATEGGGDYTAGALLAFSKNVGKAYIVDIFRRQMSPHECELTVAQVAEKDALELGSPGAVQVYIEQEPGSSGKALMDHYRRNVLPGFYCKPILSSVNKQLRATPLSSACEAGNVKIIKGQWNMAFIDEAALFPFSGQHDDQVDAVAGAHAMLARAARSRIIT